MLEEYISLLRQKIKELFENELSGHDIWHLERTMDLALFIQEHEGGDRMVVGVAAFLHDIHRSIQKQTGRYCPPEDSLSLVEKLLREINFPEEKIPKVLYAIEFHEEYNWNETNKEITNIETLIIQDADNIDAIGAIGIARTFMYSAAHGIPMYEPDTPLNEADDYKESATGDDPSTIHHFYHKLFKLQKHMNTNISKLLAKKRAEFMNNFVNEFMDEWNGNYHR